jgi:hypothetical protein
MKNQLHVVFSLSCAILEGPKGHRLTKNYLKVKRKNKKPLIAFNKKKTHTRYLYIVALWPRLP